MEKLNFYFVDKDYVDFLKQAETEKRGFSRVPNVDYDAGRKPKFLCGVVLKVHGTDYYAPLSSFKQQRPDNYLIKAEDGRVVSSLRFNYMFPVPRELTKIRWIYNEPDRAYRSLLSQELRHCIDNQETIQRLAERTYRRVLLGKDKGLVANSCDFVLLEGKCKEYAAALEKQKTAEKEKSLTPEEEMTEWKKRLETDKTADDKKAIGDCLLKLSQLKKGIDVDKPKRDKEIKKDEPEL